jgi:hypothetical protein
MKKFVILKLIGLTLLTMITLVIISVLEVTVYSYLVNPGQDQSVYEAHANVTAPYVSGICGFIIFFLVARFWKRRGYPNAFRLAMLFPLVYVLFDVFVLTVASVNWSDFMLVFVLANTAKWLGSYLGFALTDTRTT